MMYLSLVLNYRDTAAAAIKELQTSGNPYHQVISDPNGKLALDLGVIGTPETYLVDQQGRVVKKLVGCNDTTSVARGVC